MSESASGAEPSMTQAPESSFNPFRALRYGDYRFVWSSETLNLWASEMETIVLAIFVLRDTGSPLLVGLIGALKFGAFELRAPSQNASYYYLLLTTYNILHTTYYLLHTTYYILHTTYDIL